MAQLTGFPFPGSIPRRVSRRSLARPENGRWLLAPHGEVSRSRRWYHPDTLILETEFTTADGVVAVIDFMPVRSGLPDLVRIVVGRRGRVHMRLELVIRFDYGSIVPWVQRIPGGISAIGGPDSLTLRSDVPLRGEDLRTVADFDVSEASASRSISPGIRRTSRSKATWMSSRR